MNEPKLAVLGDIHGNYTALAACLSYAEEHGVTDIAFLGDYITDCPYPDRVMKLLSAAQSRFHCTFIRGNREDYMCDLAKNPVLPAFYGSRMGNIYATFRALQPEHLAFLASLPTETVLTFDGLPPLTLCHGMPGNNRTVVLPYLPSMEEALSRTTTPILLCAHSHRAFCYHENSDIAKKTVINGGTVGHPCRNTGIDAQMAILTPQHGDWHTAFLTLPYDVEQAVADFAETDFLRDAGVWARAVRKTLLTGRNMTNEVRLTVERLLVEQGYTAPLSPQQEEPLWLTAAQMLDIE